MQDTVTNLPLVAIRVEPSQVDLWNAIDLLKRRGSRVIYLSDIAAVAKSPRRACLDYAASLVKLGMLVPVQPDAQREAGWKFDASNWPKTAPVICRNGRASSSHDMRQAAWKAMKAYRPFTPDSLAKLLRTAGVKLPSARPLRLYINDLVLAGYVVPLRDGHFLMRKDRNTGPLPPRIVTARIVYDSNVRGVASRTVDACEAAQ